MLHMNFCCVFVFFFFKQKTAYEMLRSLVGSEMCIRDSPWLIRILIKIKNNCKPCHYKKSQHKPESIPVLLVLPVHTGQSDQEWKKIIFVVTRIGFQIFGKLIKLSQARFIYKFNTTYPVAMNGIPITLNIILPACKIPHKVSHVHKSNLVAKKIAKIFTESRANNSFFI